MVLCLPGKLDPRNDHTSFFFLYSGFLFFSPISWLFRLPFGKSRRISLRVVPKSFLMLDVFFDSKKGVRIDYDSIPGPSSPQKLAICPMPCVTRVVVRIQTGQGSSPFSRNKKIVPSVGVGLPRFWKRAPRIKENEKVLIKTRDGDPDVIFVIFWTENIQIWMIASCCLGSSDGAL